MSAPASFPTERIQPTRRRLGTAKRVAIRVLFGDRLGLTIFLGALAFVGLYWRVGIFITDNYTPANALVALSRGELAVEEAVYGTLEAPGMQIHEGTTYGRNYGQAAFALPFLWLLDGLTLVADPGLVFATLWSLLLLALAIQVGHLLDRPSLGASAGAVVALAFFAANAALAEPLADRLLPLAALQLSAMVAAALVGVTTYRLLARLHGRRLGVTAGAVVVAATPIGFWASIPKRHVYVAALLVGVAYALYRSRSESESDALLSATGFRALAYAIVGLTAWIHAGEGFLVFLALVLVDVPTAPSNDRRTLAVVVAAFSLSLVPFFLTNYLISGDPLNPPRMLSQYGERSANAGFGSGSTGGGGSGGGGSTGGGSAGGGSGGEGSGGLSGFVSGLLSPLSGLISEATWLTGVLFGPIETGLDIVVDEPERLYQTFVRSGYLSGVGSRDNHEAVNLTILESAPIAAGAVAAIGAAIAGTGKMADRLRRGASPVSTLLELGQRARRSPATAADGFLALTAVFFVLTYIERLPVHAQVTVRYLLVLFPVLIYAAARQQTFRRVVDEHGRLGVWAYAAGVLVGGQLFLVAITLGDFGVGESFQLHAVLGLAVAGALAVLAIASSIDRRFDPLTAVSGGLAAALGTDFLLLFGLKYYQYAQYALPAADYLAELLASA